MSARSRKSTHRKNERSGSVTVERAFELAQQLHRSAINTAASQALQEARTLYERIIEAVPDHAAALHYLGVLRHQTGAHDVGAELIRRSIRLAPEEPAAWNNLGNVLKESGRMDEALEAYRQAITLAPEHANAHNNVGTALRALGRVEESVACYRKAIELAPEHIDAHQNLGNALQRLGRRSEAVDCYRRAVALDPSRSETRKVLALALFHDGQAEEALRILASWAKDEPDNPVAAHLLAACSGRRVPPRASDAYVTQAFDGMSATFDEHLRELGYRAPELVGAAVDRIGPSSRAWDVLDAGCGTGLCGPMLRKCARTLTGVDLSSGMLARAKKLGLFDTLEQAELTAYLATRSEAWDLIVSADTLCYFGDLAAVFAASARALRSSGRLVFTVERAAPPQEGYRLQPHGRYCHGESYVRTELQRAGFEVETLSQETLRQERGEPVQGLVVVARRATAP